MPKSADNVDCGRLIGRADNGTRMPQTPTTSAHTDRCLIDAALSGDTAAWEAIYDQCHPPLLDAARAELGGRNADPNQIDELAARVWYALVRNRGELLARFDPSRGCRLTTFLGSLARDHALRMYRSERRRRRREMIGLDIGQQSVHCAASASVPASFETAEFESTLTPKEKEFYREIVAENAPPSDATDVQPPARSDANQWQLRHRVRRKLEAFLTK